MSNMLHHFLAHLFPTSFWSDYQTYTFLLISVQPLSCSAQLPSSSTHQGASRTKIKIYNESLKTETFPSHFPRTLFSRHIWVTFYGDWEKVFQGKKFSFLFWTLTCCKENVAIYGGQTFFSPRFGFRNDWNILTETLKKNFTTYQIAQMENSSWNNQSSIKL